MILFLWVDFSKENFAVVLRAERLSPQDYGKGSYNEGTKDVWV